MLVRQRRLASMENIQRANSSRLSKTSAKVRTWLLLFHRVIDEIVCPDNCKPSLINAGQSQWLGGEKGKTCPWLPYRGPRKTVASGADVAPRNAALLVQSEARKRKRCPRSRFFEVPYRTTSPIDTNQSIIKRPAD